MPPYNACSAACWSVLGSLLEKEITVPASYPMTINSARNACNQNRSREPIVDYEEELMHRTLGALRTGHNPTTPTAYYPDRPRECVDLVISLQPRSLGRRPAGLGSS
jgi:uncharacterized protein